MKFFIDGVDIAEIKDLAAMGAVDGVTTNPSIIAKSGRPFKDVIKEICEIVQGPVSAEVVSLHAKEMVSEGRTLAKIAPNVCVKVPLTAEGLKACNIFHQEGIMTNVTLCFSSGQALLAAKAGATFVSPFVGRLDDISEDGMALIQEICQIYGNYPELTTEILVASVRNPRHILDAALMGAHVVTAPAKVIKQLLNHPLTEAGLTAFLKDWKESGQKI
ncbi:MAG: fructose-6-phosphate aldolase [Alphaproteobacteria bacterium RIFCSPLOWO2_01_FULL_45_8]|nr:MAG: fructose-6-phosphate aldolase [Alphaproteobacteria bacterium GWB1_45_5]OFW75900.1 MAG: fructose-6-phosphate aldolase [Alphaproteobacteria bacterium GWA1_45_9]OFW89993.1 MAG: fructose-6-phosphate aldolase [Alphaproteobacteria bacterium RIFCSPHIGHO2_01_FULL_41_14]OFW95956.1 MAG: fructose-6-phosphate aldolase [Alphaproteobacteria bacterium RIFCSPLOWO2_01_FULL_45_8]HCI48815.1 fructose-6-phosphate aldolase [Holosporales bacterium]